MKIEELKPGTLIKGKITFYCSDECKPTNSDVGGK